jgi:peroxiredoxin Q/BCP
MSRAATLTTAPAFELPNQKGQIRSLESLLSKGRVLLAFHRGTWCPNCRNRFNDLARNSPEYAKLGVQVVAVVAQRAEGVRRYIEETGLPFDILVDESREVLKAYGVWHRIGLDAWNIARPALFLIDRDRAIHYSFIADSQLEFPTHEDITQALNRTEPTLNLEP